MYELKEPSVYDNRYKTSTPSTPSLKFVQSVSVHQLLTYWTLRVGPDITGVSSVALCYLVLLPPPSGSQSVEHKALVTGDRDRSLLSTSRLNDSNGYDDVPLSAPLRGGILTDGGLSAETRIVSCSFRSSPFSFCFGLVKTLCHRVWSPLRWPRK